MFKGLIWYTETVQHYDLGQWREYNNNKINNLIEYLYCNVRHAINLDLYNQTPDCDFLKFVSLIESLKVVFKSFQIIYLFFILLKINIGFRENSYWKNGL